MPVLTFEWDEQKNRINRAKHGVSFEEAKAVFYDLRAIDRADIRFDYGEERLLTIGMTARGVLLVVNTRRSENVRIISARRATRREADDYFTDT